MRRRGSGVKHTLEIKLDLMCCWFNRCVAGLIDVLLPEQSPLSDQGNRPPYTLHGVY